MKTGPLNSSREEYNLEQAARKTGLSPERYRSVVEKFLSTRIDGYLDELKAAITAGDFEAIRHHSHRLRGAVSNFRYGGLTGLLEEMERLSGQGEPAGYIELFHIITEEIGTFRSLVQGGTNG